MATWEDSKDFSTGYKKSMLNDGAYGGRIEQITVRIFMWRAFRFMGDEPQPGGSRYKELGSGSADTLANAKRDAKKTISAARKEYGDKITVTR